MFDIITIGGATKDVFVQSNDIKLSKTNSLEKKGFVLNIGSKFEVDNIVLDTGGGGTNTAASFANFGLKTAFFGKIGTDSAGQHILDVMKEYKVNTNLVLKDKKHITGYSTIISAKTGQRIVLVHRGANNYIDKLPELKTKWVYVAPMSGKSANLIPKIIKYCNKKNIQIAMNPSSRYIKKGIAKSVLKNIDILFLNKEEASKLTKTSFKDEDKIIQKLRLLTKGIIVMTNGQKGAIALENNSIYKFIPPKVKIASTLGAGDAFNSAFTTAIFKNKDINSAMKLAGLNATSVIQKMGAKQGLLKKTIK